MALRAARQALERSGGLTPADLDLLLYADVWHQGPEGWQPQYYLQQHLTGGDVLAIELRHGCCGLFSALAVAAGYLRAEPARRAALLVGADNHSTPLVDRWRMFAGTVMGDGACALVVATDGGFAEVLAVNLTTVCEAEPVSDGGVPMFPPDATVGRPLDFVARNREFRERLLANCGTGALLGIGKQLTELVDQTLAEAGIALSDVARVAFPHGRRDELGSGAMSWLGLELADTTWEFGARASGTWVSATSSWRSTTCWPAGLWPSGTTCCSSGSAPASPCPAPRCESSTSRRSTHDNRKRYGGADRLHPRPPGTR